MKNVSVVLLGHAILFLSISTAWIVWIEHPLFEPIDADDSGIANTAVTFIFLFLITLFYSIGATFVKVCFLPTSKLRLDFIQAFVIRPTTLWALSYTRRNAAQGATQLLFASFSSTQESFWRVAPRYFTTHAAHMCAHRRSGLKMEAC